MVSNGVKAGIGFGAIGLIAVLAVSVVTLVKVFDKDDKAQTINNYTNGTGGTIYNNTIINNTIVRYENRTVYVPTIIYQNETIYVDVPVPYNITVYNNTIHYLNNGTDPETIINIPSPSKSSSQPYKDAAKFIADSIDISVSPCDNFYQYACGKYNKTISFDIAELDNRMKMAVALNTPKASDVSFYFKDLF
uniref:Uncharacterized protein n=1 Tax=Panagrolaimus davidi TaxID=227884 RepID=A0A914P0J5_9BILA